MRPFVIAECRKVVSALPEMPRRYMPRNAPGLLSKAGTVALSEWLVTPGVPDMIESSSGVNLITPEPDSWGYRVMWELKPITFCSISRRKPPTILTARIMTAMDRATEAMATFTAGDVRPELSPAEMRREIKKSTFKR